MNNKNLSRLFSNNNSLTTKINAMSQEQSPLIKLAIKSHTAEMLSGKYSCLHMTPENEATYCIGYLAGMNEAMETWQKELDKLQRTVQECPTLFRQSPTLN